MEEQKLNEEQEQALRKTDVVRCLFCQNENIFKIIANKFV